MINKIFKILLCLKDVPIVRDIINKLVILIEKVFKKVIRKILERLNPRLIPYFYSFLALGMEYIVNKLNIYIMEAKNKKQMEEEKIKEKEEKIKEKEEKIKENKK